MYKYTAESDETLLDARAARDNLSIPASRPSSEYLLNVLKRPEYRYRYWAKRELRKRPAAEVQTALDSWVKALDSKAARHRHHQMEAVWMYRNLEAAKPALLAELLECETPEARAAATHQLRYWHAHFKDGNARLRKAANDEDPIVRMEAAIATSYIGTEAAMHALADTTKHPHGGHPVSYTHLRAHETDS